MKNETISILSKLDQPPYGIRLPDGSWKLLRNFHDSEALLHSIDKIISTFQNHARDQNEKQIDWSHLTSIDVARYISKYHPNLKLVDISVSRDFIIFSQIQAQNINNAYWKGGNAGSVQLSLEEAKSRTIAEIIERTALSFIDQTIWSSAVAPNFALAEWLAKIESIERWIIMKWWQEDSRFSLSENFIPYLSDDSANLIEAIQFEWQPYNAKLQCRKIINPFGLEIVIATVDANLKQKQWRFYGNGLDKNLEKAAQKACLETLQFIPGTRLAIWEQLRKSDAESDQRILSWSTYRKPNLFVGNEFKAEYLASTQHVPSFHETINKAFEAIQLSCQIFELQECPNIFVSYVISSLNWRTEKAVPIV